ncbi:OsmC family protein [Fervidobacterium sp. 2310opik-2]|uniref:OsmC family protein n=1 Tax=Fervidobacterium sp. 2310opik-2 TaxID=1755815 RepID=UPI0013DF04D7|nr:OsmC family protein [Fervidobacterium sp. 2310opik-2]KAF2961630.1 osmotically inducible protein C [Fervidobacterium sp. 2310opik-2]
MATARMDFYSGMLFYSKTLSGHDLIIDAEPSFGGRDAGPRPKELLLYSLMGCTGMDVVSLLRKMRVIENMESFRMEVEYEQSQEHPKVYTKIHLKYIFKFNGEPPREQVEKAVNLSQEKYCGVSAMLRKAVPEFSHEIVYE